MTREEFEHVRAQLNRALDGIEVLIEALRRITLLLQLLNRQPA